MALSKFTLTQDRLKELLHFNPDTGIFVRKIRTANAINVGDVAGFIDIWGYVLISLENRQHRAHKLAFLYINGEFPKEDVDHINHVRHDNRWVNLRAVSRAENCKNISRRRSNKSGCTGVYWANDRNKWRAQITDYYNNILLGDFVDWFEAVCARKSAENKYGFHENHGEAP